jgi:RNA polymerase sigma-70 factor (sigma-E family)
MSVVDTGSLSLPWLVPAPVLRPAVRVVAREEPMAGQRAREHEAQFAQFAAARGPALVRLARGLLRDPHQAEDVVQDVLAKTLVQWGRVSAADDMDAYVRRMVVNACTSWFRRAARREYVHDSATMPERAEPDAAAGIAERDQVVGLLRRLPDKQRAVLVLRHYEGLPDSAIAVILGTSEVTVRSNAHRGLATLRRYLAQDAATDPAREGGRR